MFWTYTGLETGMATHSLLPDTSGASRNPFVLTVYDNFLHVYQEDNRVMHSTIADPNQLHTSAMLCFTNASIIATSFASDLLLISYDDRTYTMYNVQNGDNTIVIAANTSGAFASSSILDTQLVLCASLDIPCDKDGTYLLTLSATENALVLSYFEWKDLVSPVATMSIACDHQVEYGRIAVTANEIMLFYSAEKQLYGCIPRLNAGCMHLGVGGRMSVSVAGDVMMLVTDYGYCYNSHAHNTRSVPHVCSNEPKPLQHVLDYSLGLASDWHDALSTPNKISSCHPRILHGSYDQGSHPSIALTLTKNNSYAFISTHEDLRGTERADGHCGTPMLQNGIVIDAFPINEWITAINS